MGVLRHRSKKWEVKSKIQVEAYQLGSGDEKPDWFREYVLQRKIKPDTKGVYIKINGTLQFVPNGDYIINDKHNGMYSCSVNQFNDVFEEIE